jgi:hypothetical protein
MASPVMSSNPVASMMIPVRSMPSIAFSKRA